MASKKPANVKRGPSPKPGTDVDAKKRRKVQMAKLELGLKKLKNDLIDFRWFGP
jgi:hypothetical protein